MTLSLSSFLKFVMTLALSLAVFPDAASAQNLRKDQAGNLFGPGLENMGALTTKRSFAYPDCPGMTLELRISTPYGIGIPQFDMAMARKHELDVEKAAIPFFKHPPGECKPENSSITESFYSRTFEAHYPGGGFLSIVYDIAYYDAVDGPAHPDNDLKVVNVNPWTSEPVEMADLFLDPPGYYEGVRNLWPAIAVGWCRYNDEKTMPNFYELPKSKQWCADPARAPLPERLSGWWVGLEDLGNAFLTADGLGLRLGPYQGWYYALGDSTLNIDKRTLIGLGFDPALWGR
jgi:hypothetical protein